MGTRPIWLDSEETMTEVGDHVAGPAAKPWSSEGREELAAAVRRLMAVTVTSVAPPDLLADVARQAAVLADRLESFVPEDGPVPITRFSETTVHAEQANVLSAAMPFDVIIGSCNPIALPITIEFDPPKAVGRANFTAPYEGAPGCVHGAVLAGAFDIILTAANVMANGAGPTVNLSIKYLKPTLIGQPSLFESWVTSQDDRRTHSRGHLVQNGVVTVEAVGEFVNMERSRIAAMHRRDDGAGPGSRAEA
jgi:acyl-coenzyme A thioesterase PaaI-like protein